MPVPGEPLCNAAFAFAVPDARGEAFLGCRSEEAGVDRRAVVLVKCDYSETVTIRMPREKPTSRGMVDPVIAIRRYSDKGLSGSASPSLKKGPH